MAWSNLWDSILLWVTAHAGVTYLIVLIISLSESLALVGLLVPGTVIMVGIGALAGTGAISVGLTLLTAIIGAVIGDGLSYWLGRHYHQDLKRRWPFCRYPQIMSQGEKFFQRHGGKSIFFGRFVGPVRPVIPVIAGMLDMSVQRFVLVNVLSAIGWALAYIIPGVVLAGSVALVGAVSARLSLMLLLLVFLLWVIFWLCRKAFVLLGMLGPKEERFLLPVLCVVLIITGWLFLGVLEDVVSGDPLVLADQAVYQFLQTLRTHLGDNLLVVITELGDGVVNISIAVAVLVVLMLRRQLRAALFWVIALGGGAALVELFKWALHRPRPIEIYQGVISWSFPSGHTVMSVVLYGFLAILLVRRFNPIHRWLPFGFAIGFSFLIGFSRMYLGAHWLSDVLGGLALGWAWVTLLGVIYLRHAKQGQPKRFLLGAVVVATLLAGGGHIYRQHGHDLVKYQIRQPVRELNATSWENTEWQQLPGWRIDLAGEVEQPLSFQWAGDPDRLAGVLAKSGWTRTVGFDVKKLLNLLIPKADIRQLPLLPLLENGRQERILMFRQAGDKRLVLRLWPTKYRLADTAQLLWVGLVDFEHSAPLGDLMTLPRASGLYSSALAQLQGDLSTATKFHWVQRPAAASQGHPGWDGKILLITEAPQSPSSN